MQLQEIAREGNFENFESFIKKNAVNQEGLDQAAFEIVKFSKTYGEYN